MRIPALFCAMLCLFMTTKSAYAQQLADLQHIAIVIADLSKETESVGLTKQSVSDTVLAGLIRGAPKLKIDSVPPVSVFHVKITSVINGTASFVSVSVLRSVEIAGDKGSKVYSGPVTVWHRQRTESRKRPVTRKHVLHGQHRVPASEHVHQSALHNRVRHRRGCFSDISHLCFPDFLQHLSDLFLIRACTHNWPLLICLLYFNNQSGRPERTAPTLL